MQAAASAWRGPSVTNLLLIYFVLAPITAPTIRL